MPHASPSPTRFCLFCSAAADYQALKYCMRCINESMRLYPHPPVLLRRAMVEDELPGGCAAVRGGTAMYCRACRLDTKLELVGLALLGARGCFRRRESCRACWLPPPPSFPSSPSPPALHAVQAGTPCHGARTS
jgi:hypothetical protein